MDKEKWDKLINMPENSETNTNLAKNAIKQIQGKKDLSKKNWFGLYWKRIVACAVSLVLGIGIGIPIYKALNTPNVIYYETEDIEYSKVENISNFVVENGLSICFYNTSTTKTQCAIISKTGEVAFIVQDMLYIGAMGFDKVNLKSVIKQGVKFDFFDAFSGLTNDIAVENISIQYTYRIKENNIENQILAKFNYQNINYYLDIVTEGEPQDCIETYVSMLVNG